MSQPQEHILKIGLGNLDVPYMNVAEPLQNNINNGFNILSHYLYFPVFMLDIKYFWDTLQKRNIKIPLIIDAYSLAELHLPFQLIGRRIGYYLAFLDKSDPAA